MPAPPATPLATTSALATTSGLEEMTISPEARRYWAFQKPVRAPLPPASGGLSNPIDLLLEQARAERNLPRAPRADRITLLRRAYLDLIGLPPTPAQAAEYLADRSPNAWANLIDKLLASPHYGERWGRHWLDVARYADSSGYEHGPSCRTSSTSRQSEATTLGYGKPSGARHAYRSIIMPDRASRSSAATAVWSRRCPKSTPIANIPLNPDTGQSIHLQR